MTSKKTKEERLKESALNRARLLNGIDTLNTTTVPPPGAVMADQNELSHNNTYDVLPRFYIDKAIICRACGKEEVWTGDQQKWWYEVAKGNINSNAVHCRGCREKEKARRKQVRNQHMAGLAKKRNQTK
jgi:hypothetical protein